MDMEHDRQRLTMAGFIPSLQIAAASRVFSLTKTVLSAVQKQGVNSLLPNKISAAACRSSSVMHFSASSSGPAEENFRSCEPASPYRNPGPRRFGYETKLHKGGLLPRSPTAQSVRMPRYEPKDKWTRERALFGQNDYIDILGDGDVRPFDLLKGPRWLLGFRGNEMQRVIRQLKFDGPRLRFLYPTEYNRIAKRLRYLYKRYNHKRSHR